MVHIHFIFHGDYFGNTASNNELEISTTEKIDFNGYTGHLIPINLNDTHWTLLKVKFMDKTLTYIDPIPGYLDNVVDKIFNAYIRYYSEGCANITPSKTIPIDLKEWNKVVLGKSQIGQQSNGHDCGVLWMMFIDFIHLDHNLNFNAELATDYRRLMFNHVAAYVTKFDGLIWLVFFVFSHCQSCNHMFLSLCLYVNNKI